MSGVTLPDSRADRAGAAGGRGVPSKILIAATGTLILVALLELALRAAAGLGWVSLPSTAIQGFDAAFAGQNAPTEQRLFQDDPALLFVMRPNFQRTYSKVAVREGEAQYYDVRTDAHGFRTPPFAERKTPGVFRIVCLGDSSTFGMNVDGATNYPHLLAERLEAAYPGRFEVINLGVPGYTGRQGLELLRRTALAYDPDLVTFAFGTNDRFFSRPLDDDALMRFNQSASGEFLFHLRQSLDHLYLYRLAQRAVPYLAHWSFDRMTLFKRVSLDGVRDNIVAAHDLLAARGSALLVLNTDFIVSDALEGMRTGVERAQVDFIDLPLLLNAARAARSQRIAAAHGLPAAAPPPDQMLFRVLAPGRAAISLRLTRWMQSPTTVPLRDDGTGGDQVAGDGIWSVLVPAHPGERFQYTYWDDSLGAAVKEFRDGYPGGDIQRQVFHADDEPQIDVFGHPYLMSDPTHPDEEGQQLIAERLEAAVLANPNVRQFLGSAAAE